jgi:diguanylate cyclase (GGDEF)-like protein
VSSEGSAVDSVIDSEVIDSEVIDIDSLDYLSQQNDSQFQNSKLILGSIWGGLALTVLCFVSYQFGFFRREFSELLTMFGVIWGGYALLLLMVIFGINKRFEDRTLATPVIFWSLATILWVSYYLDQLRLAVMMLYFTTMLIGAFRYKLKNFIVSSSIAIVGYLLVILALIKNHSELIEITAEFLQWGVFTSLTIAVVIIGGEIARIRDRLKDGNSELNEALSKISELAIIDELTGLYNRRYAMKILEHQKGMADRDAYDFAICFFDLDLFKSINDNYGHHVGDLVLKKFSELVKGTISDIDYCSRFGGEEFVLILVKKNIEAAKEIADSIRQLVQDTDFGEITEGLNVTVSVGVSEFVSNEEIEHVLNRADEALYEAKDSGRNQVKIK